MIRGATGAELAHWRLHSLGLFPVPQHASPEEVVRHMGAVQSQDFGPAKWSLAQRLDGVTNAEVDGAFGAGRILRTHLLRPTWHFVLPADLRWMLQLTAPRVHGLNAYYYRQQGLHERVLADTASLLAEELRTAGPLTRTEIAAVLEKAGIEAHGIRLGLILMNAELNGVICSGAPKGKQQTYALLDERVPDAVNLTREQALAELTRRYFTSHGPATVKDFRWWSSLTLAEIQQGLDMVGSGLQSEVIGDLTVWFAEPPSGSIPTSPVIHLLQAYDEYIVGYSESKYLLDLAGAARSQPPARDTFNHVVLLDGQLFGRWRQIVRKDSVLVEVAPYHEPDPAVMYALDSAADAYGRFLGLPATLELLPRS